MKAIDQQLGEIRVARAKVDGFGRNEREKERDT